MQAAPPHSSAVRRWCSRFYCRGGSSSGYEAPFKRTLRLELLADHPLLGREAEEGRRELILSRGRFGYIAKYRWLPADDVVLILAVKHQRASARQATLRTSGQ
jgi:hypothetical protein